MSVTSARSSKIDVEKLIDESPLSGFQLVVIGLCAFIAMLDGFDTQSIAFVAPMIATEWGVDKSSFGPIFSSALVGLAVGSLGLGGLADRFGRKALIVASTIGFGTFSLITAFSTSLSELMILRFLTGVGLGGAIPNIIAMTTEYAPKRFKILMVVIMFSGFPLGGLIGGLISAELITAFGWSSVFIFGGIVPLLTVPLLLWKLPESIPFLISKASSQNHAKVLRLLRHIAPQNDLQSDVAFTTADKTEETSGKLKTLFTESRTMGTLMLWLIFFTNLLMFYFMISWLPTVLTEAGLPIHLAIITAILLNAGAIFGGVVLGRLVDKNGPFKVLTTNYLLAALFSILIGATADSLYVVGALVFCAGFCVGGGQLVANGLSSSFYPANVRSTGVGWSIGLSRLGAILGPLLGGALMAAQLSTQALFIASAIPGVLAAIAVFVMGRSSSAEHLTKSAKST